MVSRLARKSSQGTKSTAPLPGGYSQLDSPEGDRDPTLHGVFWPTDLLVQECPQSRIMSYGYDSDVTKFGRGAPNKSSTFSHGKDLMFALSRERSPGRPLIFVAHSLGGIIVKEVSVHRPPCDHFSFAEGAYLDALDVINRART